MKKLSLLLFFITLVCVQVFAQLSDDQVIKLLQNAQKQGMSQQQIVLMLTQKGVTKEQILKLKNAYEKGTLKMNDSGASIPASDNRLRTSPTDKNKKNGKEKDLQENDRRFLTEIGKPETVVFEEERQLSTSTMLDSLAMEMDIHKRVDELMKKKEKEVFGHDIFNNNLLTFEPLLNIATPDQYVLGPGDEVIVDVWGASEASIRQIISPDGNIIVEGIGPIHLSGLTVREANERIKHVFGKIYAGIGAENTFVKLTLGEIRSIQVNVMGEVMMPGTYTLPSLASAFHSLYNAGGVNPIGSLRSVKIYRNGKEIADIDVYEYILQGKTGSNMILQDGDVVVVSPYTNRVGLEGKVKRPMFYEMKDEEVVGDLLNYAGGFTGDAYKKNIRIIRKSGRERQVYNVDEEDFGTFTLIDGDMVSVDSVLPRFENRAEIRGAVYREGLYAVGKDVNTVKQLVAKAEGIRGDAFLNRAVLYREKPDLSLEVISVDMGSLLEGKAEDITLQRNDVLYIPSIFDIQEDYTVAVKGAVKYPGTYKFVDKLTLEDAVVQAGGLLESASTVKVDVARRIKDPKSMSVGDKRAETYTFALKDGLVVSGPAGFTLEPFDEVYVRNSPGYQKQQNVFVEGEILFPGEYALSQKGERLSDLIKKAGNLTPEAYPEGARLLRRMTPDEQAKVKTLMKLSQQGGRDSIDVKQLDLGEVYTVGIELKEALRQPGSDFDVILREGDRLSIPEYNGTVRISGAVMYPNTVVYKEKAKLRYYISQAGGYAQRAKKSRAFIIYMNGTVSIAKGNRTKLMPGCEIIVPTKQARKGMGLTEIMSLASSTTSMAAMVTSILNMTK